MYMYNYIYHTSHTFWVNVPKSSVGGQGSNGSECFTSEIVIFSLSDTPNAGLSSLNIWSQKVHNYYDQNYKPIHSRHGIHVHVCYGNTHVHVVRSHVLMQYEAIVIHVHVACSIAGKKCCSERCHFSEEISSFRS